MVIPRQLFIALVFANARFITGMNQIQMANALGCTQGTISKIEKGEMKPDLSLYMDLIFIFKLKIY